MATQEKKSTVGSRIRSVREQRGLTMETLGELCGTTKQTIYKYETGIVTNIPLSRLEKVAAVLNTTPEYLMGWGESVLDANNVFPIQVKKFTILGDIACGEPTLADEHVELYVSAGAGLHADFCLRAKGDSMTGARIYDGDIVFVRKQDSVEDGEIAAVLIDGEATLKRVYYDREANVISLFAENPQFKTMRFSGSQLDQIRILGKAVAFQSDIR